MLKVGDKTQNDSNAIFTDSESITLLPVVSAEWNHNLFNPPYITTAGTGAQLSKTLTLGTVSDVESGGKENFVTKSFDMADGKSIAYTIDSNNQTAYKIITYVKTDNPIPVMITASGKGTKTQYGAEQVEADSLGWTKIITYVGPSGSSEPNPEFVYTITANTLSGTDISPIIYFTEPQVYETTEFDYKYHSLWPSETVFTYFRPGESYVSTGDSKYSFEPKFRRIKSKVLNSESLSSGYYGNKYMPISPIIQNPTFFLASPPVPVLKTALPTEMSPYKYFVSDDSSTSISAIYEKNITTNKIVLKFNTIMTVPTINVFLNGNRITVDGVHDIVLPNNSDGKCTGLLTLYWNGSAWTKNKWGTQSNPTMPKFSSTGSLPLSTTINKITVTQISADTNTEFESYTSDNVYNDLYRMQLVEVSPRLEIDLSDFVQELSIDKSLDSKGSNLPISSMNTNDARITLSGIPVMSGSTIVPIFSSQSNKPSTILSNMLRKNIKFYINFNLQSYNKTSYDTYIPGGVFYSDSWGENDIQTVDVQCFDISRYLQSTPVPDYVANLKNVFEVITNILDLAGFTDYDYDSLYTICNSKSSPLDLSYYYCNSKDSTILDALNQIFLAYQIGAYIDEYGVMKFLSLHNILSSTTSLLDISESSVIGNGYSVSNNAKPGKISLRYQTPKIKQSPSLQNVKNVNIKESPSFIYTTSNDVVWQQQTIDSVGFNYLDETMEEDANVFKLNNNDLLDIFHTFNLNNDGYAAIESEIVSFVYKEYEISNIAKTQLVTVSVKNNLELSAEIDRFIKQYTIGLKNSYADITDAFGDGETITYTANNSFEVGQKVSIVGVNPKTYNIQGTIISVSPTSFDVLGLASETYVSGGAATIASDYDVLITPTGNITNVQRGMFGTAPSTHVRITDLESKGLSEAKISADYGSISSSDICLITNDKTTGTGNLTDSLPSIDKIKIVVDSDYKTIIYPTDEIDIGYGTYSVKFDMPDQSKTSAGLFFNMENDTSTSGAYFVELIRYNQENKQTQELYDPPRYRYLMTITDSDNYLHAWADVTGECQSLMANFSKIIKKTVVGNKIDYSYITDDAFNLKVVHHLSDGSDGENATVADEKSIISVFLNNIEITGWQVPGIAYDPDSQPSARGYDNTNTNPLTGMKQKVAVPPIYNVSTRFGFVSTVRPNTLPVTNPSIIYPAHSSSNPSSLREIHATKKALKERSVSYFYQDREFLNGIIQGQPLSSNSPTYMMQTTPEVAGINYYDVQYTTPAAVSVDILPIEYLWYYFPGNGVADQKNYQKKIIDEYSLSYSTPLNTGFRAKMAIANNSPNMVFLHKESDELNQFTINFNLWTHEIVAPSDPEIIDRVIDPSNISEVVQIDSEWIQSKDAAYKLLKVVEMGLEGFSKDVTLEIFGNPLIQIGDIITFSYNLNGIDPKKYVVQSVTHSFSQGLTTRLVINRIQ